MSSTTATLRLMLTTLVLAVVAVITLLVIGDVYGGTEVVLGASADATPASDELIAAGSGSDVRNASVILGLLGLATLILTYFYFRHTGNVARQRSQRPDRHEAQIESATRV